MTGTSREIIARSAAICFVWLRAEVDWMRLGRVERWVRSVWEKNFGSRVRGPEAGEDE